MESWVCIRLLDDQVIRRLVDRPFCHGKQVKGGEWYDAQTDIWQTNT